MAIKDVTTALSPWAYEGGPRSLVLALKLRGLKDAAAPLIAAMVGCARQGGLEADMVTWVPARTADKRKRGFDHAEVLARGVALGLGLPSAPLLIRRGHQLDQAGLNRSHRLSNLATAFAGTPRAGGRVLLVDDLVTTGATAASCAAALKASGARRVDVLAGCRR